jgi:hypothetical protein
MEEKGELKENLSSDGEDSDEQSDCNISLNDKFFKFFVFKIMKKDNLEIIGIKKIIVKEGHMF